MEAPSFLKKLLGLRDPTRAADLVARGVASARENDVDKALELYRQAIKADDTYALAHLNVALALMDLFNEQAKSLAPDEQATHLDEIASHLKTALNLDERLLPGLRALGYVERLLGNFDDSKAAFEQYLAQTDEKDPQRERVTTMLTEVTEKAARESAMKSALAIAEKVQESDDTARADAEAKLLGVLEKEPLRAEGWWALGVLRRAAKDPKAREYLEKALQVDPHCVVAHKELAGLHFHNNQPDLALPHARAAYETDPQNAALVCNLGVCHLALGQLKDAKEFIQIAKGLAPKDPIVVDAMKAVDEAIKAQKRGGA